MSLQATYELVLRNHAREIVARFPGIGRGMNAGGGLRSFSYRKRLRTAGASNVNLNANDNRIGYLYPIDNNLDHQWEFMRNDPLDPNRGFYRDFETFHRGEELTVGEEGLQTYLSYGQGFNSLFQSEVIDYPSGSSQAQKSGDIATIAYEYIDENIGPNAGLDLQGVSRVRPNLQIAPVALLGQTFEDDYSGELLFDVLNGLADLGRCEFMIESNGLDFVVNWRQRPYGTDRRDGNAFGNVPVIFETQRANITNVTQAKQYLDAVTSVSVRGAGADELRATESVNDLNLLALSPWARRCVSRTANKISDPALLQNVGLLIIRENESKIRTAFSYRQTKTTRYGRDWDVGDFVTMINNFGQSSDMNVVGATVSLSSEGVESIIPELEEIIND